MNKRWITGKKLMELMDLTQRELYEFFILGLPVYDQAGMLIIHSAKPKQSRIMMDLGGIYVDTCSENFINMMGYKKFRTDDVRGFLEERELTYLLPEPDQKSKFKYKTIPVPAKTQWHQIHFRIVNPTRIEITIPNNVMNPYDPNDLGFTQKIWDLFERFAAEGVEYIKEEKADISRLRKLLRTVFPGIGVEGDPIPYERNKGYKAAFHITEA